MRRVTFILFLLSISMLLLGDFTENFDGWSDGSYGDVGTYDHAGVGQWENNNAMCHSENSQSGNAVRFNDDATTPDEYLLFKGLDGNGKDDGIGTINFWYRHWDGNVPGEPVEFILEYQIGSTAGTWTSIGSSVSATSTTYSEFSETPNVTGDNIFFRVRAIQDKERLLIDDMTVTDYSDGVLSANFSADVTSGMVPVTINFTNATTGGTPPYSYEWDFQNDSSTDSTVSDPSFEYTSAGTYTVKLTVTDSAARTTSIELKTDFLTFTDYYYSITATSGSALKAELHDLIDNHTNFSYTSQTLDDGMMEADEDPNISGNCIEIYTGDSETAISSKEHVWAKSHGEFSTTRPAGTDMHNLKPCQSNVNSSRGNKDFDNGGSENAIAPGNYTDGDSWEPRDEVKGDVARIMFYMATRYEGDVSSNIVGEPDLELVDAVDTEDNDGGVAGYGEHGRLSALLAWHIADPVDAFERNRNEVIFSYQGNRNPFIDHPEYVAGIWQAQVPNVDPTAVSGGPYTGTDSDLDGWANVTLDGSGSSDSDGTIVTYEWTYEDGTSGGSDTSNLFFSEYVEGSSYNKYLEIYNGTGASVDLSEYSVLEYVGGASTPSYSLNLSGSLADDSVYIIGHSSGALTGFTVDVTSSVCYFNGDDAIGLYRNSVLVDCIGQIGFDPGSAWGTSPDNTVEHTLVRNASVTSGDNNGSDAFDPVTEWTSYPQDTATYLGYHTMTGSRNGRVTQTLSGISPTGSFPLGETTVTLTVTDDDGGTDVDTATVTVSEPVPNQAPSISNVSINPSSPNSSQSVEVSADITDTDGTISSSEIHWSTTSGSLTNTVSMSLDTGDTYKGTIPPQTENTTVYYVVVATDDATDETVSAEQSYTVTNPVADEVNIFISEYLEGSSYNKAIEIYNAGIDPVNLDLVEFWRISNAGDWTEGEGNSITLSGTLQPGDVYVICNSQAIPEIQALSDLIGTDICYFNGNDAMALVYNGQILDTIGLETVTDQSVGWDVAGITQATANHTLLRKETVIQATTDWALSAGTDDLDSQWIVNAIDDYSNLGYPTGQGGVVTPAIPTNVAIANNGTGRIISWDAAADAVTYMVYSAGNPFAVEGEWLMETVTDGLTWTDIDTVNKKFYRVVSSTDALPVRR